MGDLNAAAVVNRMWQVLGVQTDTALGQQLGLGPSTVSSWRQRNHVPYAECVNLALRKGVSLDWLLLGLGDFATGAAAPVDAGSDEPRLARLLGFLRHWFATSGDDGKAWLEMQLARAVPEYAEWVAARRS